MSVLYIRDKNTGAFHGIRSIKGDTGDSGVYLGSEQPTDPKVKVWINPDGDVKNGTYELIEETTLSESNQIWRGREADGTPYNFKKLRVWLTSPSSTPGFNIQFYSTAQESLVFQKWTDAQDIFEGYPANFFVDLEIESGLVYAKVSETWVYHHQNALGAIATMLKRVNVNAINSFGVSAPMPAGTTIRIWGVRA